MLKPVSDVVWCPARHRFLNTIIIVNRMDMKKCGTVFSLVGTISAGIAYGAVATGVADAIGIGGGGGGGGGAVVNKIDVWHANRFATYQLALRWHCHLQNSLVQLLPREQFQ